MKITDIGGVFLVEGERNMDELQATIDTIIDMDEPETILPTLRRAADRKKGVRWRRLANVLGEAEIKLDQLNNAGPDFRPPPAHATETSQPEPQELTHGKHPDAAEAAAAATPAAEAPPA